MFNFFKIYVYSYRVLKRILLTTIVNSWSKYIIQSRTVPNFASLLYLFLMRLLSTLIVLKLAQINENYDV